MGAEATSAVTERHPNRFVTSHCAPPDRFIDLLSALEDFQQASTSAMGSSGGMDASLPAPFTSTMPDGSMPRNRRCVCACKCVCTCKCVFVCLCVCLGGGDAGGLFVQFCGRVCTCVCVFVIHSYVRKQG